MFGLNSGLSFAFENAETSGEGEIDEVEMMSEVSDSVDTAETINTDVERLDAAEDDVGEIEQQVEVMDEAIESGDGLSEDAAKAVEISIERACNRLNMRRPYSTRISKEAFSAPSSRLAATRIAREETERNVVLRVYDGIKKYIMDLVARVKAWFTEKFEINNRLIRAAEEMKKKASEAKGGKDAAFESKEARNFTDGDKLDMGRIVDVLGEHITLTATFGNAATAVTGSMAGIKGIAEKIKPENGPTREELVKELNAEMDKVKNAFSSAKLGEKSGDGLYKGVAFSIDSVNATGEDGKSYFKVRVKPAANRPTDKVVISATKITEVPKVCGKIIELGKANQGLKAKAGEVDKLSKTLDEVISKTMAAITSIKNSQETEGEKKVSAASKEISKAASALASNMSVIMGTLPGLNLDAMKGAYEICRQVVASAGGSMLGNAATKAKNLG